MSLLQKNNLAFLQLLSKAKPTQRRHLLQSASREEILAILEIFLNLLKGIVHDLSPQCKRKLFRHRHLIRELAHGATTRWRRHRARLVNQSGSGLIPAALTAVIGLLTSLFKN